MKFLRSTCAKTMALLSLLFLTACATEVSVERANDVIRNSVMITNLTENSGGTGIIMRSSNSSSLILTNSHVCHVVENGGMVKSDKGKYMVTGYKHSQKYDLCLIRVDKNLGYNTKVSTRASSEYYESATISGHPALYPHVVTNGHVSGRKNIPIMVGVRPCEKEDMEDPQKGIFCIFAGGLPVVKEFDSVLVTATIMPGSSGSGVYNKDLELSGVVFAGQGDLGYAWTVPYEAMSNFLREEQKEIPFSLPSNKLDLFGSGRQRLQVEARVQELCNSDKKDSVKDICNSFKSTMVYYK